MSILETAKAKAAKGSVSAAFKNESGAIDLASIMVGIIVIGLIGGVIAATVFAIIPWAQDNAAKQQLDSIAAAESAAIGLTADSGTIAYDALGAPGTDNTIARAGKTLFDAGSREDLMVTTTGSGTSATYAAVIRSASGNWFRITDKNTKPVQVKPYTTGTPPTEVANLRTLNHAQITALGAA